MQLPEGRQGATELGTHGVITFAENRGDLYCRQLGHEAQRQEVLSLGVLARR